MKRVLTLPRRLAASRQKRLLIMQTPKVRFPSLLHDVPITWHVTSPEGRATVQQSCGLTQIAVSNLLQCCLICAVLRNPLCYYCLCHGDLRCRYRLMCVLVQTLRRLYLALQQASRAQCLPARGRGRKRNQIRVARGRSPPREASPALGMEERLPKGRDHSIPSLLRILLEVWPIVHTPLGWVLE